MSTRIWEWAKNKNRCGVVLIEKKGKGGGLEACNDGYVHCAGGPSGGAEKHVR